MDAISLGGEPAQEGLAKLKFTGQIKIPDLDHPGVPAVVLIENNQTELLLQGESLGRWSLVDVRADRLIANAFSLALGSEEVTFIADEPVDFAYRGVEKMANVWARYRTMTLPRRIVANRRSRAGTKPSRITELRSAMVQNLESGSSGGSAFEQAPVAGAARAAVPAAPPASPKVVEPVPVEPAAIEEPIAAGEVAASPPDTHSPDVGRVEAPAAEGHEVDAPASDRSTPPPPADYPEEGLDQDLAVESVFKETVPWITPGSSDSSEPKEPADVASPEEAATFRDSTFAPEPEEPAEPKHLEPADTPAVLADVADASAAFESDVPPPISPVNEEPSKRFVVDLGAFEDEGDVGDDDVDSRSPDTSPEPVLAGASEKGGIMGAVRAAFVRGRPQHDHEYVVAAGGIGIIRHICTECGHISIGTID